MGNDQVLNANEQNNKKYMNEILLEFGVGAGSEDARYTTKSHMFSNNYDPGKQWPGS